MADFTQRSVVLSLSSHIGSSRQCWTLFSSGLSLAGSSVVVKKKAGKKRQNWQVSGWQLRPSCLLICNNQRWETDFPPGSRRAFLLSELLLVQATVTPDVLIILALVLLPDLCPLSRRRGLMGVGSSSGGDVATNLLSPPQTNGLWMAPFPFCRVKKAVGAQSVCTVVK